MDTSTLYTIGAAIAAIAAGAKGGWALRARRGASSNGSEPLMDPDDWKDWRRAVDEQLLALRFAQGRSDDTSAALTKQVDGMGVKLDKLLDEVRDMRIGLGQHPRT